MFGYFVDFIDATFNVDFGFYSVLFDLSSKDSLKNASSSSAIPISFLRDSRG